VVRRPVCASTLAGGLQKPTRSGGGVCGMQFALITGERRRAPGLQEHAVGAIGEK